MTVVGTLKDRLNESIRALDVVFKHRTETFSREEVVNILKFVRSGKI